MPSAYQLPLAYPFPLLVEIVEAYWVSGSMLLKKSTIFVAYGV
jgi:hypothetical protein